MRTAVYSLTFAFFLLPFSTPAAPKPITAIYAELKNEVLTNSPDLRLAQASAAQRDAALYTAWTRWIPRLDLQLRQSRSKDYTLVTSGQLGNLQNIFPGGFTPEETPLASWHLNLNMPLFRRSTVLDIRRASGERELAQRQTEIKLNELDWRLREQTGNYLFQLYRLSTLKTSIELARTNLREARLRLELGQRTRVDVLRASANLLSLESSALGFEQERGASLSALSAYSGLTRAKLAEILAPGQLTTEAALGGAIEAFTESGKVLEVIQPYMPSQAPTTFPETLSSRIPVANLTYLILLAEQNSADIRARLLMAPEWPEILIQGNLNKQGPHWQEAISGGNVSHTIALVLNIPLFSGGSLFSSYSEKRNAENAATLKREQDILRLRDEVENQAFQLETLQKTIRAQMLNLKQNEELVRLSQRTYGLGKTTLLELLASQNDWIEAKLDLAQSRLAYAVLVRKFAANLGVPVE